MTLVVSDKVASSKPLLDRSGAYELTLEKFSEGFRWSLENAGSFSEGKLPRLFPESFEERNALAASEMAMRAVYESLTRQIDS